MASIASNLSHRFSILSSLGILLASIGILGSAGLPSLRAQSATGHEYPWSWYEPEIVPWPSQRFDTPLGKVHQPQVNLGAGDELVAQGLGKLFHSVDGGKTWKVLCNTPEGSSSGVAILKDGTILLATNVQKGYDGRPHDSVNYTIRSFIHRSQDRGKSWSQPYELDPWPYDGVGSDASIRFKEDADGTIYYPVSAARIARPGKPLNRANRYFAALLYVSTDGGQTFRVRSNFGKWTCEIDLLPLGDGELLASIRYQTPGGARAAEPRTRSGLRHPPFRYKQTATSFSSDSGRTWSTPRIVTHYLQQTGCLIQLSDGTVLLPFSHKDEGYGQRFLVSYDEGQTWSKTIYELNKGGMYASSAVLADDAIVTVFQDRKRDSKLGVLRWKAPRREEVSKGGFFVPPTVDLEQSYFVYP